MVALGHDRRVVAAVFTVIAAVGAGCAPEAPRPGTGPGDSLMAGVFLVPAARAVTDPGFHLALSASTTIPQALGPTAGLRLVVRVRDVGRPNQSCHGAAASECATVDWFDRPGRPNVPSDGTFEDRVVIQMDTGLQTFWLTESGQLVAVADAYRTDRVATPIGGAPTEWSMPLPSDLVPGSRVSLFLVLSKLGPPDVRIGYELTTEPPA